jgi:alpha-galactosidase
MFTIAGRVVEEPGDWILREIDIAKEMGAEAFMVDAGWYGTDFASWPKQRGDWNVGDWMPGGLDGARNHAHKSGLLFGLWHEAECISPESKLAQQHPDWVQRPDGKPRHEIIDLANPAAAKFFEETVLGLVRDHKLDFYKLDYNTRPGESSQTLRDGFAENEQWRHFETLYRTYDRVLTEHPNACLENCASGGGRNDLGMVSRFHYLSESDISAYPYSILAINAMTMFIPPEAVAYYHNHMPNAHQTTDLETHLRVTLFGVPIFVGFGAQAARRDTEYFARTRRYIELHKGFCRPILAGGAAVYHHTPFLEIGRAHV